MSASLQSPGPDSGRRSKQVALVLLGTMGVVGGVVVWDAWRRAAPDEFPSSTLPEAPSATATPVAPVEANRTYQNNDFVPGAGYYHAPYHSWFPFPFNHHDPARGYFAGGLWQAAPFAADLLSSRPSPAGFANARAAQQSYEQAQRARAGTSGFAGARRSTFGGSSFSTPTTTPSATRPTATPDTRPAAAPATRPTATPSSSRPTATPSSRPAAPSTRPASSPASAPSKPSIQRGGFGSSGKSSGGSSS
jgi:hypothetical protein